MMDVDGLHVERTTSHCNTLLVGNLRYIGKWDMAVLTERPDVWSTAVSQIFFSIGVTFGKWSADCLFFCLFRIAPNEFSGSERAAALSLLRRHFSSSSSLCLQVS